LEISQLLAKKIGQHVETIDPAASLQELAKKLIALRIGALVVMDQNRRLVGIVSERDLLKVVASNDRDMDQRPVFEIMTKNVITCSPTDDVADILQQMNSNAIRHIPVVLGDELVGMVSIRELTTAYDMLQVEANTDHLTNLSNRRSFLENLNSECARSMRYGHSFSVAMIDIDHFKNVNDTYGHDVGDRVIKGLSDLLMGEFRTIDRIGRLGGEEFAVLFPETKLQGAAIACERFLELVRKTQLPLEDESIGITVSIGLAMLSADKKNGPEILKRADELLYDAKRNGRNCLKMEHFDTHNVADQQTIVA